MNLESSTAARHVVKRLSRRLVGCSSHIVNALVEVANYAQCLSTALFCSPESSAEQILWTSCFHFLPRRLLWRLVLITTGTVSRCGAARIVLICGCWCHHNLRGP